MSWVAYLGCVVAGATVGFCAAALLAGADTSCSCCYDSGAHIVNHPDLGAVARFCPVCELGRMYQERHDRATADFDAAWRRLNQTMTEGEA